MEQYKVTGMSCAACSARVEKAVSGVPGVTSCSVSLLTNSMGVEGTASPRDIIQAVKDAGYGAERKGHGAAAQAAAEARGEDDLADTETPILKRRLIASLGFSAVLMYVSMGHVMWGWPMPAFFEGNHVAIGILELLLTVAVMVINQKFFVNGFKGLVHRAPNMDTLVALGSFASFAYSVYALFAMTGAQARGDMEGAMHYMHEFYFESAAMILTLITVGKMLEARSKGKTTDALKSLMRMAPKTATVVRDGREETIPIEQMRIGDCFVVRPGENIPVDGTVLEGGGAVDESALTGESIPVDKEAGSQVYAGTSNQSGFLRCEARKVGEDTTLSQIIQMVSDAAATKAPIAKVADKVSGIFVPAVILIAVGTVLVWLLLSKPLGFALARGISVLVISCPCALGLATPVAIMVGNGMGAKNGILFKTAVSLEEAGKADIVALDKTGTITMGEPKVTDILPAEGVGEGELLRLAYSLEKKSSHPLAKAILLRGEEEGVSEEEAEDFRSVAGNGLTGRIGGDEIVGGSLAFLSGKMAVPAALEEQAGALSMEGKTPLFFGRNGELLGVIAVADVMKEDSPQAIREMRNMGIRVVMLTGDNERTAKAIGAQAGVDEVIAGVLPDGKEAVIRSLQEKGKVAMVGDGVNDAPALTRADVGIAIGAGTDVAIDAADIVLMKSRLSDVPAAIRLSRATLRNIHENLFWAFFYNAIGIPLAAGVFIGAFGWKLSPMFAAAAMSLSSFCVVTNALRLNFFSMHDASKDRRRRGWGARKRGARARGNAPEGIRAQEDAARGAQGAKALGAFAQGNEAQGNKAQEKERDTMKKTMKIEGMMCAHCEATVKGALEAIEGVEEAVVSHEKGTAIVTAADGISDDALRKAVEAKNYKVLSVA